MTEGATPGSAPLPLVARRRLDQPASELRRPAAASAGLAAHERHDPFFEALWPGSHAVWATRDEAEALLALGKSSPLLRLVGDRKEAASNLRQRLESAQHGEPVLRILAALHAWRTATLEQLSALTGDRAVLNSRSSLIRDLFSAGLIDLGAFSLLRKEKRRHRQHADLVRLGKSRALGAFAKNLEFAQQLRLTDGDKWIDTNSYERHDVLALELGLRAAEFLPIAGVLGERFSKLSRLAAGPSSKAENWRSSADLTLIRRDGMAIAVELTANTSQTFAGKVSRWVKLLSDDRYDGELCVVFLLASRQGKPGEMTSLRTRVERAVREQVFGQAWGAAAPRVMVASWVDWFPQRHIIGAEFHHLSARKVSLERDQDWSQVRLLPPALPAVGEIVTAHRSVDLLRHSAALEQTPHWLKCDDRSRRERVLIQRSMASQQLLPCCSNEAALGDDSSPRICVSGRMSHCPRT